MADDDVIDDEFEANLEGDLDVDADELDEEDLEVSIVDDEDALVGDAPFDADVPEVVEPDEEPAPRGKKKAGAGEEEVEDDDDDADPDDVEADLEQILRDRIAAAADDDDDDEVEVVDPRAAEAPDGVTPKKANEFVCPGCFLLVNRGQFGPSDKMICPVGEGDCPAIAKLRRAKK